MKRSNPSGGKKTHIPSDFKRLKAKVGKRAPQKANVTETKFRTASVQVRSQTIVDSKPKLSEKDGETIGNKSMVEMVSSKGKHLSQLLVQLNHPSPQVRLSSLQGIKDASKNTPDEVIPNYLSLLVGPLSKAMVDDDSKVRKLSRIVFFQDISTRILTNHYNDKMKPFLPLSLAYIASALHSLDQDVRYDGCLALENLCRIFGKDLNGEKELYSLFTTIPAFAIVFEDVSGSIASVSKRGLADVVTNSLGNTKKTSGGSEKNRKNKKKQSSGGNKSIEILKSFIAIMKVATLSGQEEVDIDKTWMLNSDTMKKLAPNGAALLPSLALPNLIYLQGGMSTNAIVWNKMNDEEYNNSKSKVQLKGLNDLSLMLKLNEAKYSKVMTNKALSITTQIDLLTKLRNRFVEVTQKGNHEAGCGLAISSHETNELLLLVSALRLLWNCHPRYFDNEEEANAKFLSKDGKTNGWKKFKRLAKIILNMQINVLPIRDPSGNITNKHNYDLLNASLCCAISEFGSVLEPPNVDPPKITSFRSDWVATIFSYLLPHLKRGDSDSNDDHENSSTRVTLMKVVEQLLFRRESGVSFLEDKDKQMELLSTFSAVYFSDTQKPSEQLCQSLEGRRAVYILISLLAQFFHLDSRNGVTHDIDNCKQWMMLSQMVIMLPRYLLMWRGSFNTDSMLVLSTLLSISRRCKATNVQSSTLSKLCVSIRKSIQQIFTTQTKADVSVFEELSTFPTQKLAISLLGSLGPSDTLLSSLAQICARHNSVKESRLNEAMVDYIMSVLYSMKDCISLEQYVVFLIESIGFSHISSDTFIETAEKSSNENVCLLDKALARSCRYLCLVLSDDKKTLEVITPYLISFLEGDADETMLLHRMKARAAISFLSCWSILHTDVDGSCYFLLESEVKDSTFKAVCDLFLTSLNTFRDENSQLISPIMVSATSTELDLLCSSSCTTVCVTINHVNS